MKNILLALSVLISTQTFAATCKLSTVVGGGFNCHSVSTRLDVADQETCEAFARGTKDNRFFGVLEKNEIVVATKYTFKDKAAKLKVKKRIDFEDSEEICN